MSHSDLEARYTAQEWSRMQRCRYWATRLLGFVLVCVIGGLLALAAGHRDIAAGFAIPIIPALYSGVFLYVKSLNRSGWWALLTLALYGLPLLYILLFMSHARSEVYDWDCLACGQTNDKLASHCTRCQCPKSARPGVIETHRQRYALQNRALMNQSS